MPTHRRTFPGTPQQLRTARNWIRAALANHPHTDDVALILTELGTNAIIHTPSGNGAGTFDVALTITDHTLTIAVTDSGATNTAPRIQHPSPNATHGRGLAMIAILADRIHVHGDHTGRTITAELHTPADNQPTPLP